MIMHLLVLHESIDNNNTTPEFKEVLSSVIFANFPVTDIAFDIRFRTSGGTLILRNI